MIDLVDTIEEMQALTEQAGQAYFHFAPRKDQPEKYDQQSSFVFNESQGVTFLIGGNGAGTTECAMHKLARFIMNTPPPRLDTPFWIIGNSYDQVMDACWKEKLYGHGHIPKAEVDWDRVAWYKPNLFWPFKVPL
ncbi:MAG TPA: hypothetical protein VL475_02385, partial [Planctomycetaceae bacterium]|nr:hypothetical protein [Planctomycetaceae bacterium]